MNARVLTTGILMMTLTLFSQKSELDRSDWMYWQQDRPLTFQDFKGEIGTCGLEVIEDSVPMEDSACLELWSIFDIPKSWKEGIEYERF